MKNSSQWLLSIGRCLTLLNREMQTPTTLRYHFSPIVLAKIQTFHNTFYRSYRETGRLIRLWQECEIALAQGVSRGKGYNNQY